MATAQQTGEQRLPLFDRSPHRGPFRIVVLGNHRLIALVDIPVNVTLVVIRDQHLSSPRDGAAPAGGPASARPRVRTTVLLRPYA